MQCAAGSVQCAVCDVQCAVCDVECKHMQELMPGSRPELRQPLSQPVLHQLTVVMVESPLNPHGGVSAESSWRSLR